MGVCILMPLQCTEAFPVASRGLSQAAGKQFEILLGSFFNDGWISFSFLQMVQKMKTRSYTSKSIKFTLNSTLFKSTMEGPTQINQMQILPQEPRKVGCRPSTEMLVTQLPEVRPVALPYKVHQELITQLMITDSQEKSKNSPGALSKGENGYYSLFTPYTYKFRSLYSHLCMSVPSFACVECLWKPGLFSQIHKYMCVSH